MMYYSVQQMEFRNKSPSTSTVDIIAGRPRHKFKHVTCSWSRKIVQLAVQMEIVINRLKRSDVVHIDSKLPSNIFSIHLSHYQHNNITVHTLCASH